MKTEEHWEQLLQNQKFACFLADMEKREIFYVNDELEKITGSKEGVIGKTYMVALAEQNFSVISNTPLHWDFQQPMFTEVYNKSLNLGYITTFSVIPKADVIFCSLKPINGNEVSDFTFENTLSKCIATLTNDETTRNLELLKILGEFYNADKAYLYLVDRSTMKIPCAFNWTKNESITVTPDLSEKMDAKKLLAWFESGNEAGIIDTAREHNSFSMDSVEAEVLNAFHLENIVASVVEDTNSEALGMVIVSNRKNKKADFRLLQAVTRFMEKEIAQTEFSSSIEELNDKDILTGFYNRSFYASKVDEFQENPPKTLGVFLANVNGLRKINAEYGYAKGDGFIKKASEIIKAFFETDIFRIAGDEFVAFFPEVEKEAFESQILSLREKLKEEDSNIFALGHAWGAGRFDCGQLIREADTMMYINKQEYYHSSNRRFDEISDSTLSDLLSFLDDGEFMIYLQPQVILKDASLYGAEALIRRFDKKNQKMVFPDQFISLYEQKSVIRHIDLFVVNEVCRLLATWIKTGKGIPISVNLSRVTLQEYGIVDTIVEICDKFEIPHELLVIEVTERVGLIENNVASALISAFKENGFNISLDDFGCAYSNIVTLAQIRVDEVKLDKSLVDHLITNSQNHILVKNVLTMCNELDGASTLAEGIEDESQAKMLHDLGCHLGQGYFYSRPIPVSEFEEKYIRQ
ncbi:MAG: EAL domain-containing protein [Eubacteriales bacterium]